MVPITLQFQHPLWLAGIPILIILSTLIIRKNFVKKRAVAVKGRMMLLLSRALIFTLLIIAAASPFQVASTVQQGDPHLTIFVDRSESMELLDTTAVDDLIETVQGKIPVTLRSLGEGSTSALGDSLLSGLRGEDNVLLITDGNDNTGRALGDVLTVAAALNASVSAVSLEPISGDTALYISGPRITTSAEENTFSVIAEQVGPPQSYVLTVTLDGNEVHHGTYSGSTATDITRKLGEGIHTLRADIIVPDHFSQNNVFFKTIKVEPKPRILFVSSEASPLTGILGPLYDTTSVPTMSGQAISSYSAVVLNNLPASAIDVPPLSTSVADGNGLVVVGGSKSYDRGGYKGSLLEGMLPVVVGKGEEEDRQDVNIILLIDISGSTGGGFGKGSTSTIEEVEKALAVGILNDLRKDDRVGVIAFNTDAYTVAELATLLGREAAIKNKIQTLTYTGGTRISEGITAARKLLAPLTGSRNIILLSDGQSGNYAEDLYDARISAGAGIKIFTIGVGEGTNRQHMQDIANAGNGYYFEPDERSRLKILFGETEAVEGAAYPIETINTHHFITRSLTLAAGVEGFNQVVPKPHADLLVATQNNNPILTTSRLGLGRIAAYSTDDGSGWAGQVLSAKNSILLTRMINWAVGDLSRNKQYDVDIRDIHLGEDLTITVISDTLPDSELSFAKTGNRMYSAMYTPDETGVQNILGGKGAVNYPREYLGIGMNPLLARQLDIANGELFASPDADAIVQKAIRDSRRISSEAVSYSWLFLLAALVLFLADIAARRITENRRKP
jgi:hypothetical protein